MSILIVRRSRRDLHDGPGAETQEVLSSFRSVAAAAAGSVCSHYCRLLSACCGGGESGLVAAAAVSSVRLRVPVHVMGKCLACVFNQSNIQKECRKHGYF